MVSRGGVSAPRAVAGCHSGCGRGRGVLRQFVRTDKRSTAPGVIAAGRARLSVAASRWPRLASGRAAQYHAVRCGAARDTDTRTKVNWAAGDGRHQDHNCDPDLGARRVERFPKCFCCKNLGRRTMDGKSR
jgi:hypothetical protein